VALNRQNQRFEDNSLLLKTSGLVHLIDYSSTASNLQIPSFSQRLTNALHNGNKPCAFACRRRRLEAGLRTKDRAVTISGSGKNRILSNHSCLVCSGACIRAWKTSTVLAHLIICLSTILSNTSVSHISLRFVAYHARYKDAMEDNPQAEPTANPFAEYIRFAEGCHIVPHSWRWVASEDLGQVQDRARHLSQLVPHRVNFRSSIGKCQTLDPRKSRRP
jgi:hypothetical protein